jgi:uncharacterized protein (TIGR03067 family)
MCTAATVNGKELPQEVVKSLRLTLTADRYITQRGTETLFDSTYRVDVSKMPHHINMLANEGPTAGQDGLGIYSLQADTLRLCYTNPGAPRPTEFTSLPGSKATLVVWKRETASR